MNENATLLIEKDVLNFSDFDKINDICTLTFAGSRIVIYPVSREETDRKFCIVLGKTKKLSNLYLADYIREVCNIEEANFSLEFIHMISYDKVGFYYYTFA